MEKLTLTIKNEISLIDQLGQLDFPHNQILKLLKNKDIRLNGQKINQDCDLKKDDELVIFYTSDMRKPTQIIYQDENILIINKPYGIEVEGNGGLAEKFNGYAVHRLDRNTTGLLILALNKNSQQILDGAFKERTITKKYLAECIGKSDYKNFTFNAFLVKDKEESKVKIYTKKVANSQAISTTFNTLKSSSNSSLIECTLHTGKTHQIRASLAYLNHPIIGDGKYGKNEDNKRFNETRQRLHSYYLKFNGIKGDLEYLQNKEFVCYPNWYKN